MRLKVNLICKQRHRHSIAPLQIRERSLRSSAPMPAGTRAEKYTDGHKPSFSATTRSVMLRRTGAGLARKQISINEILLVIVAWNAGRPARSDVGWSR